MSNWNSIVDACFPGAEVVSAQPLAGDASTRRYVRLALAGPGAPASAVAMVLPDRTPHDAPELPFLNVARHLEAHGIATPRVYGALDRELGVILLEDVGSRPLATALSEATAAPDETGRLVEETAGLLARLCTLEPEAGCIAYGRSHDSPLVRRELEMIRTHGLAPSDRGPVGEDRAPDLAAALARLGRAVLAQPRRFMHRDFHAWNLHVDDEGRLRLLDFQDAMLGPPAYDLASLCTDRDSDAFFPPEREDSLLEAYARALAQAGADLYTDPAMLRRDYFTCVAFRTLRVIGRFRFLAIEEGNDRYLHYLPRMGRQTRRALDEIGETELADLLASRNPAFT